VATLGDASSGFTVAIGPELGFGEYTDRETRIRHAARGFVDAMTEPVTRAPGQWLGWRAFRSGE